MWRKVLIGLFFAILLAVVPGCGNLTGEEAVVQPEDPGGETPDDTEDPGTDAGLVEDPDWEIQFTAQDMFSGRQVNFPADFSGDVIYLSFYFYG